MLRIRDVRPAQSISFTIGTKTLGMEGRGSSCCASSLGVDRVTPGTFRDVFTAARWGPEVPLELEFLAIVWLLMRPAPPKPYNRRGGRAGVIRVVVAGFEDFI